MKRRAFLGALAGVVAAGKAAPSVLARMRSVPVPQPFAERILVGRIPRDEAFIAQMRYQSQLALERLQRDLSRQFYGEPIPWSAWDRPAYRRRPSIGFSAWERQVLG